MARIRTLKPELPQDEGLGRCSIQARWLFVCLITQADDHGRFRASPALIRGVVFPYDEKVGARSVGAWLDELASNGVIRLYAVNGEAFLDIPKWEKHQRVDNAGKPLYPGWDDSDPNPPGAGTSPDPPRTAANRREPPRLVDPPAANRGDPPLYHDHDHDRRPPRAPAREAATDDDDVPDYIERLVLKPSQLPEALAAHRAAPEGTRLVALDSVANGKKPAGLFLSKIREGEHLRSQPPPKRPGPVDAAVRTIRATQRSAGDEEARNELARLDDHLRPLVAADLGWTAA